MRGWKTAKYGPVICLMLVLVPYEGLEVEDAQTGGLGVVGVGSALHAMLSVRIFAG